MHAGVAVQVRACAYNVWCASRKSATGCCHRRGGVHVRKVASNPTSSKTPHRSAGAWPNAQAMRMRLPTRRHHMPFSCEPPCPPSLTKRLAGAAHCKRAVHVPQRPPLSRPAPETHVGSLLQPPPHGSAHVLLATCRARVGLSSAHCPLPTWQNWQQRLPVARRPQTC